MACFPLIRPPSPPLGRCDRGISAVEFAIAAPLLFLLIIGMFEIALVTFVSVSAESGLRAAARFGLTGQMANDEAARQQKILEIFGDRTLGLVDLSRATITLKSYDSFNDVGQPEPFVDAEPLNGTYDSGEVFTDLNDNGRWDEDRGVDGVGKAGDVVLYRVEYEWSLFTPLVAWLLGEGGRLPMSASTVVRNEPWSFGETAGG